MSNLVELSVRELMHPGVTCIKEDMSVLDAMRLMVKQAVSSLVVEKEHARDAYGIITRKDMVIEAAENWDGLAALQVRDLATKPVVTITPDVGIKHAVRLMRLIGVRRLVVTEGDVVVGMISNGDVFRRIIKEMGVAA